MIGLTAFRRTAGLWPKEDARLRPARAIRARHVIHFLKNSFRSEKSSDNDKYGTGSLVAREGQVAHECWRRRLYKLVRTHGSGKRSAGKRPPFGSHTVSQELDSGALCRARAFLLAGRDAGSAPDRPHRAHRDAMRGASQGGYRAARGAAAGWPARARAARDRHRA